MQEKKTQERTELDFEISEARRIVGEWREKQRRRPIKESKKPKPSRVMRTLAEWAEISGVSLSMLYKKSASGELPITKIGRRCFIFEDNWYNWLDQNTRSPLRVIK